MSLNQCCFCVSRRSCRFKRIKGIFLDFSYLNTHVCFYAMMVRGKDDNRWRIWEDHEKNNLISNLDLRLSTRLTWLCTSSCSRLCNRFRPRHSACSGNTSWSSSGPWHSSWWWCTPCSGSCDRYRNRRPRSWSNEACRSPTLRRSAGPPPSSWCDIWGTFSP